MKTAPNQAYKAIRQALERDVDVRAVTDVYDEQVFGNFHLAYWRGQRAASIVCDRGQIFFCDDLKAENCRMITDLFDHDEVSVLEILRKTW